ncbi:WXG100 family type VII secretion target [Shouchella miscanthi]|uniref:ESAT-6-like protein n=1 Tax=Shouchella miscanthi TaxID=2598861 RepID=A0ABU6NMM7_9BACI|nr:WXG100 family type VII secretion target [Shouchella miscanthi]
MQTAVDELIRVTPEELYQKAEDYNRSSGEVHDLISRLDGFRDQLQGMWDGQASEAFVQQYDELKPSFVRMGDLLGEVSEQLRNSGRTLEETDQQIAGNIRG